MRKIFLDSAIIIRVVDDAKGQARARAAAEALMGRDDVELVTSALVLAQVFSGMTRLPDGPKRKAMIPKAHRRVEDARELATAPFNTTTVEIALRLVVSRQMALWDATNWASAIQAGCDAYASFDAPGLPHTIEGVRYLDPMLDHEP